LSIHRLHLFYIWATHRSVVYARHLPPLTSFSHIYDLCSHVYLTKPLSSLIFFVKLLLLNVVGCLFVVRLLEIVYLLLNSSCCSSFFTLL
jgi:hypothetical protein